MFNIQDHTDPLTLFKDTTNAKKISDIAEILRRLPIVDEHDYFFEKANPLNDWQHGKLHWMRLGRDSGHAAPVNLAAEGLNAIAERIVNAMEALIELERPRELKADSSKAAPAAPREAVRRYFD